MKQKIKILLVEDDESLGLVISDQLKIDGYKVTLCKNGAEGFQTFNENNFHICVFDVMMPKMGGFELAKNIRKINKDIPILFLTAKSDDSDKIQGFKAGGDDYLTKPFNIEELQLRLASLLKRVNIQPLEEEGTTIQIGGYQFDVNNFELTHPNFQKTLTKKEAKILKVLCQFINQVTPREVILNGVWGQDDYFVGRSLDVFITKIRKYLKEDENISLTNVHGIGFKLEVKK